MAIIMKGYYTPSHKPEPSLHEKLKQLRMTSYPCTSKDARPLPIATKGGCFMDKAEKKAAHESWQRTYQKAGA